MDQFNILPSMKLWVDQEALQMMCEELQHHTTGENFPISKNYNQMAEDI